MSLDTWPADATSAKWEPGYLAFQARHGAVLGPGLNRSVFFAWLASNAVDGVRERLKATYLGFEDPECDPQPNLTGNPVWEGYVKLCCALLEPFWAVQNDGPSRDLFTALRRKFPKLTDAARAYKVTFARPEDADG